MVSVGTGGEIEAAACVGPADGDTGGTATDVVGISTVCGGSLLSSGIGEDSRFTAAGGASEGREVIGGCTAGVEVELVLNVRGVDVRGGGRGPLTSPLTLLLNSGSRGTVFLPFLPRTLPSLPPALAAAAAACLRASCSSKLCSKASSTSHSAPLPFSSLPRRSFLNPGLDDRLCRTELCVGRSVVHDTSCT